MLPFKAKRQQRAGKKPTKIVVTWITITCPVCKGKTDSCLKCFGFGKLPAIGKHEEDV